MGKQTWKPGNHHPIEQKSDFAKQNPKLYEAAYKDSTIPLSGEDHVYRIMIEVVSNDA